jgi:para-aminobenzoate synthetase component 1
VILSSSPERFLRIEGEAIEARPIKGTRPRGSDPIEDRRLGEELLASPKDRAELLMIVDLLRNDLGRVCRYGSVQTESIASLESYETVHHLVGVVRGRLRPDAGICEAVRACFPGGSITGAPKIRAMEIIEEMESVRRGVYCGAIGHLGFDGRADLNIAIRTAVVQSGRVHLSVGGGIVTDSDPDLEYEETLHKAEGVLRALGAGSEAARAAP